MTTVEIICVKFKVSIKLLQFRFKIKVGLTFLVCEEEINAKSNVWETKPNGGIKIHPG